MLHLPKKSLINSMEKKEPMRRCLGCGESFPKKQLVRIVLTPEGEVKMDLSGRLNGRGAYICRNTECLDKAIKRKLVNKALKAPVSDELAAELKKELM